MEMGRTLKGELNKARKAQDNMERYPNVIRTEAPFDGSGPHYYKEFSKDLCINYSYIMLV